MAKDLSFFTRLQERAVASQSLLCVGLDPHPELLEEPTAEAARAFCLRLIEATADLTCAFKPNSAFFEALGPEGFAALREVIAAVPEGVPVILDAKRGDIASTARAYARAVFEVLGADAVTVSPYLGRDSLAPFVEDPERGVFLLCKTSNPGAADLQGLATAGGDPLYLALARRARAWSPHDNLGLVVGATDPAALAAVRQAAPDLWLLTPGVGAQGGDLEAALRAGLRSDGLGMVIPVSRAIAQATDPRAEALRLREAINAARQGLPSAQEKGLPPQTAALADALLEAGCVRFGRFTLKSGLESPIYIDLRRLISYPRLLEQVARAYLRLLRGLSFDRIAGLPYAALPIVTAVALAGGYPALYPRKEAKGYGTQAVIEGDFQAGETVVVLDDLTTTGLSKFEAVEKLTAAGLVVRDVVVLIDRQSGARQALAAHGLRLHAVMTLGDMLDHWQAAGKVERSKVQEVRVFLGGGSGGRDQGAVISDL